MTLPTWITADDVYDMCSECTVTVVDQLALAIPIATEILYDVSGQQFQGIVEEVVRPLPYQTYNDGFPSSAVTSQRWASWGWCSNPTLDLGYNHLRSIERITIDGTDVALSALRIYERQYVIRTDDQSWPQSNDLTLDPDQVGTWEVAFTWGDPIPGAAKLAAARLACELALAMIESDACQIPKRAISINRQGTSMQLLDPADVFKSLWEVDVFLTSVNPNDLQEAPICVSPDTLPKSTKQTWSGA